MAAIQLSFSLRTSSNCKTVHLIGNWDNYKGQLPMSKDSSKSGSWKGTFRFSANMMQQGQRYWYYYIMDGYHVSHDPAQPSTVEPTTQRKLNILDIPAAKKSSSGSSSSHRNSVRRESAHVAHGRSISPSKIVCPQPSRPHETRAITTGRYSKIDVDALSRRLADARVSDSSFSSDDSTDYSDSEIDSDVSSDLPSLSSSRGSPASSGIASPTSPTGSACACPWSRTSSGEKRRVDCGGSRCGSSDAASSDSEDEARYRAKLAGRRGVDKRQGVVVRHSRR